MTALAVPLICSPLTDQAVQFAQQSYSHLADLELADHPSEDWFRSRSIDWKRFLLIFLYWRHKMGGIRNRGDENESWMGIVWTHGPLTWIGL